MSAREIREDRIKDVIAKHVSDEKTRAEIWRVIDEVIWDERSDSYDEGMWAERETHY